MFPPHSYAEILTLKVMVLGQTIERRLGHEGSDIMNRINALIKEVQQRDRFGPSIMWEYSEIAIYEPEVMSSTRLSQPVSL